MEMAKVYPLGLVGESNYQPAIRRCSVGERVYVSEEINNPYDDGALAVERNGGAIIGYIPRNSWLREVVHEGQSTEITVKSISDGGAGQLGVVVDVIVGQGSFPRSRDYREAKPAKSTPATKNATRAVGKSIGASFLKSLFGGRR